jgi:hypothetical protein
MPAAVRGWPPRRWVAAGALLPVVVLLLAAAAGGARQPWWGWPAVVLTAVPASMVLASYLPRAGTGRRLDVGCSPCAAAAALTVLLAVMARSSAPADPVMALIAVVLVVAGLRQRLSDATACSVSGKDGVYPKG